MARPALEIRNRAQIIWPGCAVGQSPLLAQLGIPARGRNYIFHIHPTNPLRVMLDNYNGSFHYGPNADQEIDTAWVDALPGDSPYQKRMVLADYHAYFGNGNLEFDPAYPFRYVNPITGDWLNWQPNPNCQWTNDLNSIANASAAKQAVAAQINDDTLFFPGAYGSGWDFHLELQPGYLQKRLVVNSLAALGTPSQAIIDGGNPRLMVSFQFQRSAGVTIWLDGVQWAEGNGQSNARQSVNEVEFRASDGTVLWHMSPAHAWDSNQETQTNQITGPIRFRRSGASFMVELHIPWSWLQTAVYPVIIDPTINPQVGATGDDGWVDNSTLYTALNNMTVGDSGPNKCHAGFRWTGVTLSGTIDISYITIVAGGADTDATAILIDFEDGVGVAFPSDRADFIGRTRTTANVAWSPGEWVGDTSYNTPSINSILQELVDSYTISNTALLGFLNDNGSGNNVNRLIRDYTNSSVKAAILHVEYTEAGATVSLATAQISATGQALADVVPGAVSKLLNTAQVAAQGQAATIQTLTTIPVNSAQVVAQGQALAVQPGAVSLAMSAAQVLAQGQSISVVAPSGQTITLNTASLAAQGQVLDVLPGAVAILLDAAQIIAQGQALTDVIPGAVAIALASAQIAAQGQTSTILPGPVLVQLAAAQISASGQAITIALGATSILLDTAQVSSAGQALEVLEGPVSILLDTAQLTAQGQAITIQAPSGASVLLDTAQLATQGQALVVQPGAAAVLLDTGALIAQGQALVVDAPFPAQVVGLDTALLASQGQALDVIPGVISVTLLTASLQANAPAITVIGIIVYSLYPFTLYIRRSQPFDATIQQSKPFDVAIRQEEAF